MSLGLSNNRGYVWVWGYGGSDSPLGVTSDSEGHVCFPQMVPQLRDIVNVGCSIGANGAVTKSGVLYTWGKNYKFRLLQPIEDEIVPNPTIVKSLRGFCVETVHFSEMHACVKVIDGRILLWGCGNGGCLGDGCEYPHTSSSAIIAKHKGVDIIAKQVCLSTKATMILANDGDVYVSGENQMGKLGLGKVHGCSEFIRVDLPKCMFISLGSLYSLVLTIDGIVFAFGSGIHGNLGIGKRVKIQYFPIAVPFPEGTKITYVSALIEQPHPKSMILEECEGNEGPTSFAIDEDGRLFAWGTSHKGKLGNCCGKVLCPKGCDELVPVLIGGESRNTNEITHYLEGEYIVQAIGSHIHSAVLSKSGKLFTFGCGSDGRMGLDDYIYKGRKQRLKFYRSAPTAIETFQRENIHVSFFASSRNHMICIGNK